MSSKFANLWEDFLILVSKGLLVGLGVFIVLLFMGSFAFLVGSQVLEWLRTAEMSPRDGFWLYGVLECGSIACRPDSLFVTDLAGVNKIINWLLDIHLVVYSSILSYFLFFLVIAWAESISKWEALERKVRAIDKPK